MYRNFCFGLDGLDYTICRLQGLLNSVVPLLITLGVVYLVWGIVQYVIGDSDEAKTKGRDKIIYGIIGLVIIVGLWGLVYIVFNTFGLNRDNYAPTPMELNNLLPQNKNLPSNNPNFFNDYGGNQDRSN